MSDEQINNIRNHFSNWWVKTVGDGQWTTLERLAARDAWFAALGQLAAESKPEPSEDDDILRAEAEFQCDRWLGLPRDYSDICPKYGQGDKALKACGFIDGFLLHASINAAHDARIIEQIKVERDMLADALYCIDKGIHFNHRTTPRTIARAALESIMGKVTA